ncbi:MAG: hypothetical protein ACPHDT_15405, partial [Acidimicrobiales bacterium]
EGDARAPVQSGDDPNSLPAPDSPDTAYIEQLLAEEDTAIKKVIMERLDLVAAIEAAEATVDLAGLEDGFVAAAAPYSDRKNISYAAWREVGVSAEVLKRAGITRS